jgi:hypothetical protein
MTLAADLSPEALEDDDLRATNLRLLRELDKAKATRAELVDAVYRAAKDAASTLVIPPVGPPAHDRRRGRAEVAVAMLSDWQLGKRTPTYDSDVCARRVDRYGERIVRLTGIQRADHPVRDLRVWLLGDLVEGELIFPGQAHRIDASLYRQVTVDGPRILGDFLRAMLAAFERVSVTAVIGNHGAIGGPVRREMHPESNADQMLYRIVEQIVVDPRLSWNIAAPSGERGWYAIDRIGEYSSLLFHGDQVRGGFAGMPFYGFYKAINGWASGAIREPFMDAACGHWHQSTSLTFNTRKVRVNGTTESYNTFAQESMKAMGEPSQRLLFVDPDKGRVTAEYEVYLE